MKTRIAWGCWGMASLFVALWGLTPLAHAYSGEATDQAFGALLSMPQAKPSQGRWIIPEEYAFEPKNERQLIAHLKKMKREGADLNAVRHRGTLLDHAIRAGLDGTAVWLLDNGASPSQGVPGRESTADELALKYKRTKIFTLLKQRVRSESPGRGSVRVDGGSSPSASLSGSAAVPKGQGQEFVVSIHQEGPTARELVAGLLRSPEFQLPFKDEQGLAELIRQVRDIEGGLSQALDQLPPDFVRDNARRIVDLIASTGYVHPKAASTGCLLSTLDLEGFKSLWPEFQRVFSDAREQAPGLVLRAYRLSWQEAPCYGSGSSDKAESKLRYLYEQGLRSSVSGLRIEDIQRESQGLFEIAQLYVPSTVAPPRWISDPLECKLELNSLWFDALRSEVDARPGRSEVTVRAIQVPGRSDCGLWVAIEGPHDISPGTSGLSDGLDGPGRETFAPSTRDRQYAGGLWFEINGAIQKTDLFGEGGVLSGSLDGDFQIVRDTKTGKRHLVNTGKLGGDPRYPIWGLPDVYELRATPNGLLLYPRKGDSAIEELLRSQCEAASCRGFAPPLADLADEERTLPRLLSALRRGQMVDGDVLTDLLGSDRKKAYHAAVLTLDRARHQALLKAGIRPQWTAEIMQQIGDLDLSLEERRHRMAIVFSNYQQLDAALTIALESVVVKWVSWLPREDWGPILKFIQNNQWGWYERYGTLMHAARSGDPRLACDIDRTLGLLCGGGIEAE